MNTKEKLEEIHSFIQKMSKEYSNQCKTFLEFVHKVEGKGALDTKTKELISIALAVAKHCEYCIAFHVKNALDAGATKEEIIEAGWVAGLMDGSPGIMYMIPLLKAIEDLSS
jgi:AhpD family alkylhydroperoxidase